VPEEIKHYFETFQHEYDKDKKQFYHFDTEKILPYKKEKERKKERKKEKTASSKTKGNSSEQGENICLMKST